MPSSPDLRFLDRTTPPHIATLILLAGISALSMNIFLPSLPNMTAHFDTEYRLMLLSVALYLAVNAVLQLFIGPISDRYGRRPVLLASLALFLIATLGCIFAPNAGVFLAFRMAQAVVVTGMVLSRAVVRDMVPDAEAASMIGYVTMGMALVPMIGPAVGGVLDAAFGWQASFGMLALLGLGMLALTWADLGETAQPRETSLLAQFREYPELFRSRRFWGYALAASCASGAFFAYLGGAPFVGSEVLGLSPAVLGLYFGLVAVGYMAGNYLSGRYSVRVGINTMIFRGTLVACLGPLLAMALFGLGLDHPVSFFGSMVLVGLGNGMTLPNATAGMLSVRPHLAGTASGLGGAIMIGGGAGLSALAGAALVPSSGPWPLLAIMLATSAAAVASVAYVRRIDLREGPLVGTPPPAARPPRM
ncbi:MFS transporter, DHA1 family, bicyclomycin/chloramphenicol resistance protein [Rhodovulum sp. ES.010]|uniref:multidrug effflux MFS transporter n=1 Tax=Rhodovulum sp. ES.010 TaxID=1882821 RepID=UPI0009272B0A|nr:multidrug effflux MFS transporter [Rhodovulum sp. ES.010]SIO31660.1 MFS transporter, DHA1 family, bicyclomycin/chloramphenicol resistance protein [Rhodovulum sp. ES.010]